IRHRHDRQEGCACLQPPALPRRAGDLGGGDARGRRRRPRAPRRARAARRRAPAAHAPWWHPPRRASPPPVDDPARGLPPASARARRRRPGERVQRLHRLDEAGRSAAPVRRSLAHPGATLMETTREQVRAGLEAARYVTTPRVETALFLTLALEK